MSLLRVEVHPLPALEFTLPLRIISEGDLDFEVFTLDRPNDEDNFDEATYTLEEGDTIIDARVSGRHFSQTVRSNVLGGDYRLGIVNLEVQDAGERR